MSANYDAIVIGTGPAGGAAAIRLAEAGARVLILDRQRLPRDKACGGGLMPQVSTLLDWDFSAVVEARTTRTRSGFAFSRPPTEGASDEMLLVKRREFDMHLIERALELGEGRVVLNDGVTVERVEEDAAGITVVARGGERWSAAFLVGADGAAGASAAALGLARRTRPGVALDADIEVPQAVFEQEASRLSFEFSCLKHGYGWIFPKNGYLSCGVGSWSGAVRLPRALDSYLEQALPPGSVLHQVRRGHPIPLYDGPQRIGSARACLAGDSASLVDPVMGEGIRFAIWSGQIAAGLIAEQLSGATPLGDGTEYSRRVHAAFGLEFDRLRRYIQPIFFKSPDTFFTRFIEKNGNYLALARVLGERLDGALAYPFGEDPANERMIQS